MTEDLPELRAELVELRQQLHQIQQASAGLQRRILYLEQKLYAEPTAMPQQAPPPAAQAVGPAVLPEQPPAPRPAQPQRVPRSLPSLDPGQVLAWAGAAIVVCGLGFLVSLGISRGIIGPGARVGLAALLAAAFVGLGWWAVEQRNQNYAGQALMAVGIAGSFGALMAASTLYGFIAASSAVFGALLCGAAATLVAWRWNSMLLAGIGLGGALLSPLAMQAPASTSIVVLAGIAYLAAAVVCAVRPWPQLLLANLLITLPQLYHWAEQNLGAGQAAFGAPALQVLIVYSVLWMATTLACAWPALQREGTPGHWETATVSASVILLILPTWGLLHDYAEDSGTAWLLAVTVSGLGLVAALRSRGFDLRSLFSGAVLGVSLFALAFAFASVMHGPALVAAWSAEIMVLAWVNQQHRLWHLRAAAVGLWALSAGSILVEWAGIGEHAFSDNQRLVALLLAAAAAGVGGWLEEQEWRLGAWWAAGLTLVVASTIPFSGSLLIALWAAVAVGLFWLGQPLACSLLLGLAGLHAFATLASPEGLAHPVDHLDQTVFALAALAGALLAIFRSCEDAKQRQLWLLCGLGTLVYLGSLSAVALVRFGDGAGQFTPDQQGQVALSVFWTLCGLAAVSAGLIKRMTTLRRMGLFLIGVAVAKLLLIDLGSLDAAARTVAFIVVGIIVLCAAFVYRNISQRIEEQS